MAVSKQMKYDATSQLSRLSAFQSALSGNKFTDVTFVVGPQKVIFRVVRVLIASISPVFTAMLFGTMKESAPNAEVIIEDIDANAFKSILYYAYMQNPRITDLNVVSVHQICDKYQIKDLQVLSEKFFVEIITPHNLCSLLSSAVYFKTDKLITLCRYYQCVFSANTISMVKSKGFLTMNIDAMKIFLQCGNMNITEDCVWEHVEKWATYQQEIQVQE
eukprot:545938_1